MNKDIREQLPALRTAIEHALASTIANRPERPYISAKELAAACGRENPPHTVRTAISGLVTELGWVRSQAQMMGGVTGTFYVPASLAAAKTATGPTISERAKYEALEHTVTTLRHQVAGLMSDLAALTTKVAEQEQILEYNTKMFREDIDGLSCQVCTVHGIAEANRDAHISAGNKVRKPGGTSFEYGTRKMPPSPCAGVVSRVAHVEEILRAAGADIPTTAEKAAEKVDGPGNESVPGNAPAP